MSFLERVWQHIRSGTIKNFPNPVMLNVNMVYTVQLEDRTTNLIWLPYEFTGLCYRDIAGGGAVNIFPYYQGTVIESFEILRGTDLHKPKTEKEFFKVLYGRAYELQEAIRDSFQEHEHDVRNAADYILKMHAFAQWLRYYNSVKNVGKT